MLYPKIQTIFKRDMALPTKPMKLWDWTHPEFQFLSQNDWEFTEKVDGTNVRIIIEPSVSSENFSPPWTEGRIRFGGRTENANMPVPLLDHLNDLITPDRKAALIEGFPGGAVLYGEGIGKGIQKGIYGPQYGFILFDVFVIDKEHIGGGWWLEQRNVREIADTYGFKSAPVIARGSLVEMIERAHDGFLSNIGFMSDNPGVVPMAEGLIGRPMLELLTRRGSRIITKLKTKDFVHAN